MDNSTLKVSFKSTETLPLVSVVVPNYNYARFLPQRMESILAQSYQNIEILLLDDCSSDNSTIVMEQWRNHPKVRVIDVNQHNSGSPFAQWSKGVRMAKGKYVWIAEADDYASPEFLKISVALLENYPEAGLSMAGSTFVDSNNNPLPINFDYWKESWIKSGHRFLEGSRYLAHNMYWACYIYNASAVVFKRELFPMNAAQQASKMRNAGDWLIWSALIAKSGVVEIYKKLNFYRQHGANITIEGKTNGNMMRENFQVLSAIEKIDKIGFFNRHMRRGQFYKKVKRLNTETSGAKELRESLHSQWKHLPFSYFCERLGKIFLGNLRCRFRM